MKDSAAHDRCWADGNSGFTLLELLVVLVISSLAVGSALVYRGQQPASLRVLAVQLASQLNAARETAIATDQPIGVLLDANGTRYRVPPQRDAVQLPKSVRLAYRGVPGLSRSDAGSRLEFFPDGSSTGGAFQLSDAAGSIVLRIELLSGAVVLERAAR